MTAVIIPARMHSTRLPEKMLLQVNGLPLVICTALQASKSNALRVIVATDHQAIVDVCKDHGIRAVMTKENHPTGTDRIAEAVEILGLSEDDIVVNVQGDEPLIPPQVINDVARNLELTPDCSMSTAAHPICSYESFVNPNVVKVLVNKEGKALMFSRAPIPWPRDAFKKEPREFPSDLGALHHIGIYAYRVSFLKEYPKLTQPPIEKAESLEQLRALWHGYGIKVVTLPQNLPAGVDTLQDLERVRAVWQNR